MFIPDQNFSISDPGSKVKKIPDPGSASASKNFSVLTHKIISKLSKRLNFLIVFRVMHLLCSKASALRS